jgi:uncharacterized protein (TIGR02598 family)
MNCTRRNDSGFSLIEVTFAIGIISFCLVAIFGLFGVGLNSNRQSTTDATLASIASRLSSEIRSDDAFDLAVQRYYTQKGVQLTSETNAIFAARFTSVNVPNSELANVSPHLKRIAITVTWPQPVAAETNIFHVTLPVK